MKYIPTAQEPEKLRAVYKEQYGDTSDDFKHDRLDWLELRLLNDEYQKVFGTYVGTMCVSSRFFKELNSKIRDCIKSGVPYDNGLPDDVII